MTSLDGVAAWLVLFGLGSVVGSFLNVVIYRVPAGKSIVRPGSHCPHCGKPIPPYLNVPILSFLMLKGRCRDCRAPISWRYPAVEALTGGLAVMLFTKFGWSVDLLRFGVMTALLVALSAIDIATYRLPNALTLTGAVLAVLITLALQPERWFKMLLGAVTGVALLGFMGLVGGLLFRKPSLGLGDVKLAGMMGLYLEPARTAGMFILGVVLGAVFGGSALLFGGKGWGSRIPFGPYLAAGGLVSLMWGGEVWNWYWRLVQP